MNQMEALQTSERLFQQTLRAYTKAGRKGWDGPLAFEDQVAVKMQMQALFELDPLLASYFFENALHVVRLFRKDSGWVQALEGEVRERVAS